MKAKAINKRNAKEERSLWSFQPQFRKKESCSPTQRPLVGSLWGDPEVIKRTTKSKEKLHGNATRSGGVQVCFPETSRSIRNKKIGRSQPLVANDRIHKLPHP